MSNLSSGKPTQNGPGAALAVVTLMLAAVAIGLSAAAMMSKDERKLLCESHGGVIFGGRCVKAAIFEVIE